jgi:membrane dipeptidase
MNPILLLAALLLQDPPPPPPDADPALWKRALELHYAATVVDTHSDTTSNILDDGFDMGARSKTGHMDLPRIASGGLDVQFYSIYVSRSWAGNEPEEPDLSARRALRMTDGFWRQVAKHSDRMEAALTVADIRRIVAAKKHAALMGIEGGHAIEGDLALLRMFHRLGIRYMTLTHTNTNQFADSCADQAKWNGLNELGVQVVHEMNRLGMLVDVSHVSDAAFFKTLEVTRAPVILSHSSCRALCPAPRNVTDEMLKALAKNGGVCMVNFGSLFLTKEGYLANEKRNVAMAPRLREIRREHPAGSPERKKAMEELEKKFPPPEPPPLSALVDHITHVIEVAGPDHVGFGSDFDGVPGLPKDLEDCSKLPWITYELLRRKVPEETVKKTLGENLLRVFAAAEKVAAELQKKEEPRQSPEPGQPVRK